jgi:DNA-binding NarL/FixJ family response regulator
MGSPAREKAVGPSVLLVDDEPLLLDSIGQELAKSFRVFTAASAADADTKLAARHYDVIVCDHMLPGEPGLDFLARTMEMVPSTKRILLTGYTSPEFITRSTMIAGLSACLVKPVRASDVAAAVTAALAS